MRRTAHVNQRGLFAVWCWYDDRMMTSGEMIAVAQLLVFFILAIFGLLIYADRTERTVNAIEQLTDEVRKLNEEIE